MLSKRRSGLGSLIPGADLATEGTSSLAPLSAIAVNPYQPRKSFQPEALDELTDSIRRYGVLQPLSVRTRDGGYELIAGERRLQAARRAGLTEVPVFIRECSDEEMLALALVENLQREDLNAMEAARSYQQLLDDFGLTQSEVAERVGKSRSAVANTMRLLMLPSDMQHAIAEGTLSEGHGRALLSVANPAYRLSLFHTALDKKISVRELEALANPTPDARPARKKSAPAAKPDANLAQLQQDFQHAFGTRVRFRSGATAQRGIIEIEYYSEDDLERIREVIVR